MPPVTRYTKSGDVHVAYQVFGEGPINLILAPGFVSNIDNSWNEPEYSRWLFETGRSARCCSMPAACPSGFRWHKTP